MYKIKIPKILFLALDVANFYKRDFYNTNDLTELSNRYKQDLVRQRADKTDYKYLDDTKFGGLRGNFSTLVTWKGFVKRGSSIVNRCSIGRDSRLVNAICNGEIILDKNNLSAHTQNKRLKELLELESWLLTVRENQAHIKSLLEKRPELPLTRDNDSFPKVSVVKTNKNQYFIRSILNNFVDSKNTILEFSIYNLWEGVKLKKKNLHPLIVIPTKKDSWSKIYAIKNEDLFKFKPILLRVNLKDNSVSDELGNNYNLHSLEDAVDSFSVGDENIKERLEHDWKKIKLRDCNHEVDFNKIKQDEFSLFLEKFLEWKKEFMIGDKKVVGITVSSSGGPDVILIFSGGTTQKLELEHNWKNYLDHGHYKDNSWLGSWIFAHEEWDKDKIIKLFKPFKKKHNDRIPNIFLCIDNGTRKAYEINWDKNELKEIDLKF